MYKCKICNKTSEKGKTMFKKYEYREKEYPETNRKGKEISLEKDICLSCKNNHKDK